MRFNPPTSCVGPRTQDKGPRRSRLIRRIAAGTVTTLLAAHTGSAANITWSGNAGNGSWHDAANWIGSTLPADTDDVVIPTGTKGPPQITVRAPVRINNLTMADLSRLTVDSTTFLASGIANVEGAELEATRGGSLTLPGVTTWSFPPMGSFGRLCLSARGFGSRIDLPNLLRIEAGPTDFSRTILEALAGGTLSLPSLQSVADNKGGCNAGLWITADGAGSLIDMPSLTVFRDNCAGSRLAASEGATIRAPLLKEVLAIYIQAQNAILPLPALEDARNGNIDVAGNAVLDVPRLGNLDHTDIRVSGGARLALPAVTTWRPSRGGTTVQALVKDPGSLLDMPNLALIRIELSDFSNFNLLATSQGILSVPSLTQIIDTAGGATINRVSADLGGIIYACQLRSFRDESTPSGSAISASNAGKIYVSTAITSTAGLFQVAKQVETGGIMSECALAEFQITVQPRSQTIVVGSPLTLSVEASAIPPVTYAWFKNGVAIPSASVPELKIASAQSTNAGTYTVQVTSPAGVLASNPALIRVGRATEAYRTWITQRFNPESWSDDSITAPESDPDRDGLSNEREYSLGTDPLLADSDLDGIADLAEVLANTNPNAPPESTVLEAVVIQPAIELLLPTRALSRYVLQQSSDLKTWIDSGPSFLGTGTPVRKLVSVTDSAGLYFRLRKVD
jgi:hypothetical protein